jgi:hypothetical protein
LEEWETRYIISVNDTSEEFENNSQNIPHFNNDQQSDFTNFRMSNGRLQLPRANYQPISNVDQNSDSDDDYSGSDEMISLYEQNE